MSEKACSQSSGEKMPDGQYMGMARSGDRGRKGSDKKEACSKCCDATRPIPCNPRKFFKSFFKQRILNFWPQIAPECQFLSGSILMYLLGSK